MARVHRRKRDVGQIRAHGPGIVGSDAGGTELLEKDGLEIDELATRAVQVDHGFAGTDPLTLRMDQLDAHRRIAFAGDTGGHRYNWPYSTIQEAAINGFYGSAFGMFHIKSQPPGGRSETYNFAVMRQSDQQVVNRRPDAEMLLGFINRQRSAAPRP